MASWAFRPHGRSSDAMLSAGEGVGGLPYELTPFGVTDNDTGSAAEAARISIAAADTGSGADSASVATGSSSAVSSADTATSTDAATVVAAVPSSDTAAGAEAATVAASISSADAGSGADAATLVAGTSSADTVAGTETATLAASGSVADTGAWTETPTVAATSSSADTGAGLEGVSRDAALGLSDDTGLSDSHSSQLTGAGTSSYADDAGLSDTSSLDAAFNRADTASFDDAAVLTVLLTGTDSVGGVEATSLNVSLSAADSGTAAEGAGLSGTAGTNSFTVPTWNYDTDELDGGTVTVELTFVGYQPDDSGYVEVTGNISAGVEPRSRVGIRLIPACSGEPVTAGADSLLQMAGTSFDIWLDLSSAPMPGDGPTTWGVGLFPQVPFPPFPVDPTPVFTAGTVPAEWLGGPPAPSQSDDVGLSDTLSVQLQRSITVSDSAALDDSVQLTYLPAPVTDDVRISDAVVFAVTQTPLDAAGLTDTVSFAITQSFSDSSGMADSTTASRATDGAATDIVGLADSVSFLFGRSLGDILDISDAVVVSKSLLNFADSTGMSDDQAHFSILRPVQYDRLMVTALG